MAEIFISYKSERRAAAEHFAEVLRRYGYSVWFDYELVKGKDFAAQIERQIREARALVALWCTLSVGSRWVREEVHLAHDLGILVPVKIEPCEIPFGFRLADTIDLASWDGAPRSPTLDSLIDALEGRIGRDAAPDRKALIEYEATWRRFGARTLKDFALNAKLAQAEPRRFGPDESNGPDNGLLQWSKEEWERLKASADIGRLLRFAEHAHPYYAAEARERVQFLQAEAERLQAEAEAAERERKAREAEAARRAAEEATRLAAQQAEERKRQEKEARYRAEGRIRVQAALVRPAGLEWFLPGAGKEEGFKDLDIAPEMVIVPAGCVHDGFAGGGAGARGRRRPAA